MLTINQKEVIQMLLETFGVALACFGALNFLFAVFVVALMFVANVKFAYVFFNIEAKLKKFIESMRGALIYSAISLSALLLLGIVLYNFFKSNGDGRIDYEFLGIRWYSYYAFGFWLNIFMGVQEFFAYIVVKRLLVAIVNGRGYKEH